MTGMLKLTSDEGVDIKYHYYESASPANFVDFIIAPPHPRRLPGRKAPPVTTIPPFDFLIKELRGRQVEVTP